jgi:hypothetical protein
MDAAALTMIAVLVCVCVYLGVRVYALSNIIDKVDLHSRAVAVELERRSALEIEQRRAALSALAAQNDASFIDIAKEIGEQASLHAAAVADCVREISEVKAEVKATIPRQTEAFCKAINALTDEGGELPLIRDRLLKLETAPTKEPPKPREKPPVVGTFQQQRQRASSE